MKIAILDDYRNVAPGLADWDSLAAEVVVFTSAFADGYEAVRSLAGFDVLVAMRERTRFPAGVLERLTGLRLLVSTGPANAAIDVAAARRHGITVCGTGYESHPAIEHTWALILGAARNLPAEAESMRSGGWQVTVGEGLHGKTLAPTRFVTANGVRYAYRRFGADTGTPVVFLQHFRGGMDNWDPAVTDSRQRPGRGECGLPDRTSLKDPCSRLDFPVGTGGSRLKAVGVA